MWYHLSTFLHAAELGVAYAAVTTASALSTFVGGPVAALLLSMNGFAGLRGWQWCVLEQPDLPLHKAAAHAEAPILPVCHPLLFFRLARSRTESTCTCRLFLLEGLPAVVLGILLWKRLAPSPATAECLQPDERSWLVSR